MFISRHLLSNLKSIQLPFLRPYPATHFRRDFTFTPRPQASENSDAFLAKFKDTSIFQKLADKPDALRALSDFAKMLKEQGMDIAAGQKPSTWQMLRLAANLEFREAAKRVMDELQKAGIDVTSQDTMAELMNMRQGKPGS